MGILTSLYYLHDDTVYKIWNFPQHGHFSQILCKMVILRGDIGVMNIPHFKMEIEMCRLRLK